MFRSRLIDRKSTLSFDETGLAVSQASSLVLVVFCFALCGCKAMHTMRTVENTLLVTSNALVVVTNDLAFFTNAVGRLEQELRMTKESVIALTGILKLKDLVPTNYYLSIAYSRLSIDDGAADAVREWKAIYQRMFDSLTNHPKAMEYFGVALNTYGQHVAAGVITNTRPDGRLERASGWPPGSIEDRVFSQFQLGSVSSTNLFQTNLLHWKGLSIEGKFEWLIAGYVNQLKGTGSLDIAALQLGDTVVLVNAIGEYEDKYTPPTLHHRVSVAPSETTMATKPSPGSARFALRLDYTGLTSELTNGSASSLHLGRTRIPIDSALRGEVLRFVVKQQVTIPEVETLDIPIEFQIDLKANFDLTGRLVWTGVIRSDAVRKGEFIEIGTLLAVNRPTM